MILDRDLIRRLSVERPFVEWDIEYFHAGRVKRETFEGSSINSAIGYIDCKTHGTGYILSIEIGRVRESE